ncbi:glycosyltransferase [Actinomadura bangladeshensis]|uniref:Glycosyltransferase n=1 Tax=Actinomadura bangladeshensis TaxID=453573 RepID=A0A6L9QHF7_9ACTN|nr:glycosyltransferase [Actinomadura bangladeshensis]NEA24867.1 glycosyltransferase [Actinomadura bangladeshensis]
MPQLLVSVIIPVFNCRDTVSEALDSVFAQTMPAERIETIVVDDGSTDGSAELLDDLARAHDRLTVLHQPNSGGAGAPRNRGLERASGKYVFFLDADDRLGPEALERMVAMAERNDTDIVLGKQLGVGGRKTPKVFGENVERTHVLEPGSELFRRMSMAALQLFRRSLIEDAGLRFAEGVLSHEDQLFTAGAHLRARAVSILADYDCYHWMARSDGTSSTQLGGAHASDIYAIVARAMDQAAEYAEPGEIRDRLHRRYLDLEVFGRLERLYLGAPGDERKITYTAGRELLEKWLTPTLLRQLPPLRRVVAHCLLNDLAEELEAVLRFHSATGRPGLHLEDGRCFQKYPYFRDEATGIPDACYEIATTPRMLHRLEPPTWADGALLVGGTVVVRDTDEGTPELHLVLEDGEGARHRVACANGPAERTGEGMATSYTATLDPASHEWRDGRWAVSVEVSIGGHLQSVPVLKPRDMHVPAVICTRPAGGARLVRVLPVRGKGALALELGGALTHADFPDAEVDLGAGNRLRVRTGAPAVHGPGPAPAMSVVLRHSRHEDAVIRAELRPDEPARLRAEVSLARARTGRWAAYLEIDGVGGPVRARFTEGSGVPGPVTASWAPPRRLHVRLDDARLTALVTDPVRRRLGGLRRRWSRTP